MANNRTWLNDLVLLDRAWTGNADIRYAENSANLAYYEANSNTVYIVNLANAANYQINYKNVENYSNVYTDKSEVIFQFEDYKWTIYYEPRIYNEGNLTVICDENCCTSCGKTIDDCNCTYIPESKGCGFEPGDIIYQDPPGQPRITATVIEEDEPGLNVQVKRSTGRFVPNYPIGKLGEPPCVLVNIVYLDFDFEFFFGGYIILESGQSNQDCFEPCAPHIYEIASANCAHMGPLDDIPIWNILREDKAGEIVNTFEDNYYILPNQMELTSAFNNSEPLTPIGYMTETWADPSKEYVAIGMNVDRLRYNVYTYGAES